MNGFIVVTGASGWVGKTALFELQKILPSEDFQKRVLAFASSKKFYETTLYSKNFKIPVYPLLELSNFAKNHNLSFLFHCAFLTREKVNILGIEEYIRINKSIINSVCSACKSFPNIKIISISSGAANKYTSEKNFLKELHSDPYGVLKREEELRIQSFSNSLILRIYALSGRFMKEPNIFALGNFIIKAMQNEKIQITSKTPVIRSYGNASDICKFAWSWLFDENNVKFNSPINAVSLTLKLDKLAQEVSNTFNSPGVVCDWDSRLKPNSYIAETDTFKKSLEFYGLRPKSLIEQIKDSSINIDKDSFI